MTPTRGIIVPAGVLSQLADNALYSPPRTWPRGINQPPQGVFIKFTSKPNISLHPRYFRSKNSSSGKTTTPGNENGNSRSKNANVKMRLFCHHKTEDHCRIFPRDQTRGGSPPVKLMGGSLPPKKHGSTFSTKELIYQEEILTFGFTESPCDPPPHPLNSPSNQKGSRIHLSLKTRSSKNAV